MLRNGFIGIVTGRNWSLKFLNYFSLFAYIVNSWLKIFKFRAGLKACDAVTMMQSL